MEKDYTHITIVLDRSGSMNTLKHQMEEALNSFIEGQKAVPGKCLVSLHTFDDVYETEFEDKQLNEVPKISINPRNATAYLDALGKTINSFGSKLSFLAEQKRPEKVIIIVITDGLENASKEYTKSIIKELITKQQEIFKWQFIFLGANFDAVEEAEDLGIQACSSMSYAPSSAGSAALGDSLNASVQAYRSNVAEAVVFSTEDKNLQAALIKQNKGF